MKHRRIALLAALGSLLFLLAAGLVLGDCVRLLLSAGQPARSLLMRILLLCLLVVGAMALGLCSALLLYRERAQRSAIEYRKLHLLAQFSNIYVFEYHFQSQQLSFSDNLPVELGLGFHWEGAPDSPQLRSIMHPDDSGKLHNFIHTPPQPGQEALTELRLRHSNGVYVWYEFRTVSTYDRRGRPYALLGRFENIDARKRREATLISRSTCDDLTGLLNRSAVNLCVEEWMHSSAVQEGAALFMLDLDNFKSINDTHGHSSGDRALLLTAQVLRETFRCGDIIGRAGGDEFLVFMTGVNAPEVAAERAATFCHALEQRSGGAFTCSIGIALSPQDGTSYAALFETADAAMYMAKREGKNSYRLASAELLPGA